MVLQYEGKQTEAQILRSSKEYAGSKIDSGLTDFVIHGDNFKALSMLLSSGFTGKVDLIYIDPPFATTNTFVVTDDRTSTMSSAADGIVAYSDTLTGSEYLEFIRERLILLRELLSESGSIYLHIDYKIGHYVKVLMDEVFGVDNFINDITRIKCNPKNFKRKAYGNQKDLVLFYAKNKGSHIFNDITMPLSEDERVQMFNKFDVDGRRYNTVSLHAPGESKGETGGLFKGLLPPPGRHWRTSPSTLAEWDAQGLIEWSANNVPRLKMFADEHTGKKIQDIWLDYKDPPRPLYPTQKNNDMLEMIVRQSSNEDSLVLDCFCGSGGTLLAAKKLGRRFIGVDESPVAIDVIRSRLHNTPVIQGE